VAEGLLEALSEASSETPPQRALIARAAEARDALPEGLRAMGADVDVVALYDTVAEPLSDAAAERLSRATYITFTSSSTVRFLLEALAAQSAPPSALPGGARLVSIGPVTSETLRAHGLEPDVEAERHDVDGLVDALVADAAGRKVAAS
jgi:uroporphyrinogen III methyltransferase / synthase